MLFAKLFAKRPPRLPFSPDIPVNERPQLLAELKACANRRGGALKNARRAQALADLFMNLSPAGKQVFADTLDGLNDAARQSAGEQYAEIEEAELFGGSDSKLAVLDMFEEPRRRVLGLLGDSSVGADFLNEIRSLSRSDVRKDIDDTVNSLT